MFGDAWTAPQKLRLEATEPATKKQSLLWERELLGLYITEHPLEEYRGHLKGIVIPMNHLSNYRSDDVVAVAGVVESVRRITTKKGDPMAFVKLADAQGSAELVVFPTTWQKTAAFWENDKTILLAGKVSRRDGDPSIVVDTAEELKTEAMDDIVKRWSRLRYQRREPLVADEHIEAEMDSEVLASV